MDMLAEKILEVSYILLSATLLALVVIGYRKAGIKAGLARTQINKSSLYIIGSAALWFTYLLVLEKSGLILDKSLPPKLPVLIVLPFTIFTILFYRKNKENQVLKAMPVSWLVYIQSFRIVVEIIILYTFIAGVLPKSASFEGYNFDVMMGLAAPFVGYFLFKNGVKNLMLARIWNVFGIVMILFVAAVIVTSYYQPLNIWGSETTLVQDKFFSYPYLLLPAFLAPMGIFFHVVSMLQLRRNK
jgi:hypothetical protein